MRVLLVLLVLLAIGGYFTRPSEARHRGVTSALITEGKVGTVDPKTRGDAFGDFYVVTESQTWTGENKLIQCWGAFTRFLCFGPPKVDAAAAPAPSPAIAKTPPA